VNTNLTVTLRPATAADVEMLAELVLQLFQSEMPGTLHGPRAGQFQVFRCLLAHELSSNIHGRFLALDEDGTPVGTLSLRLPSDPGLAQLPPQLLSLAFSALGLADTLRFIATMLRGSLSAEPPLRPGESFIYSVVIAEHMRERGLGSAMMDQLEHVARQSGAQVALLRVVRGNTRARAFYLRHGYQMVGRTPIWLAWFGFPSELLRKDLTP
jgi:ribosomal protein S18 acetylase RimI-like enzyme